MRLQCSSIGNSATGYGLLSQQIAAGLMRQGVELIAPPDPEHKDRRPVFPDNLWLGLPAHVKGWFEGQRNHVLTMWESTSLPEAFRAEFTQFDTILVPSEQNVALFSNFHPNVRRVPLGVDPIWHYRERSEPQEKFTFLCAGRGSRKSVDICVRAFLEVFGGWKPTEDMPIPELVIKTTAPANSGEGVPGIREIAVQLPLEDEVELYAKAHCFLGLARGEGWGLMPFQAMAQGCPTILSDGHGHADFAHLTPMTIDCKLVPADPFVFGDAGEWWQPDFAQVCEQMWEVYLNYGDYLGPARYGAQVIAEDFTWDHSAKAIIAHLGFERLSQPELTRFIWHPIQSALFHIVTTKDRVYEVNGMQYKFEKGVDYWEYADLKRIMFEHGILDPRCLDRFDSGLLPGQISTIERYKAQHAFCHECGQRLNMDPSMQDSNA